jgi:hypothetical protein
MKDFLGGLVEQIELTDDAAECRIHYRISTGDKLATPRTRQFIPVLRAVREVIVGGRASVVDA